MRTLYIECAMGAAGDMLMSALAELTGDIDGFTERFNRIGLHGVTLKSERAEKCGILGTHMTVAVNGAVEGEDDHAHHHIHLHHHSHTHDHKAEHAKSHNHEHSDHHNIAAHIHTHEHTHEHTHSHDHTHAHSHASMAHIEHIIKHLDVSDNVKYNAIKVYKLIAEAESAAHGKPISEIHFHEVGTMDTVADVVGCCMLIEELAPERIICSPINVGSGSVKCAHGILPVPAPATAYILKDVPIYSGDIKSELCTPTGAALLRHFSDEFGAMPVMCISRTGYGMGTKNFDTANCVRIMLGDTENDTEQISELICNIDDMTGEEIGYAVGKLFEAGALDVFTTPISMKKNRPGIMLTCMCRKDARDDMLHLIFRHTSTIGVREHISNRYVLKKEETTINTNYGEIKAKTSSGYGVTRTKPEYDELARIADENSISLRDIK